MPANAPDPGAFVSGTVGPVLIPSTIVNRQSIRRSMNRWLLDKEVASKCQLTGIGPVRGS